MPFDPVLGMGREPIVSGGIRTTTLLSGGFVLNGGTGPEDHILSTPIASGQRIFAVSLGVTPDIGANIYCDTPMIAIFIDGQRIKEWMFPDYSQSWYGPFGDIVNVDIPILSSSSTLEVRYGPTANLTPGYSWKFDVRAFGLPY